jgi:hypothetical protein
MADLNQYVSAFVTEGEQKNTLQRKLSIMREKFGSLEFDSDDDNDNDAASDPLERAVSINPSFGASADVEPGSPRSPRSPTSGDNLAPAAKSKKIWGKLRKVVRHMSDEKKAAKEGNL